MMYYLQKTIEISSAHKLNLPYESRCTNVHGHNWIVTVFCKSKELNNEGMIIDFTEIKKIVDNLDHKNLNDILPFSPTAENIAKFLVSNIPKCYKVTVQETLGNIITYEN